MKVTPIRTRVIRAFSADLNEIIAESIRAVPENSIIAITSKIISLCEGNVVKQGERNRDEIIEEEADLFLPKGENRYNVYLTVKNNVITPNAGVDESNTGGDFVLWPKDTYESARRCWEFVREHYGVKNVGIIITDSTDTPLKWGVTGICIGYCGFTALNSKVGKRDLFGREMTMTKINIADALAASAVLCMGETNEQTPMALIGDPPFVRFKQEPPTAAELKKLKIDIEDDLFGQLLKCVKWQKGKKKAVKR